MPQAISNQEQRTLPVAPQHASLASSIRIRLFSPTSSSSAIHLAALAPVMPLPIITVSAYEGNAEVVLWPRRNSSGSACQKDFVGCNEGSPDGLAFCWGAISNRRW
jgi:hypothetical protein